MAEFTGSTAGLLGGTSSPEEREDEDDEDVRREDEEVLKGLAFSASLVTEESDLGRSSEVVSTAEIISCSSTRLLAMAAWAAAARAGTIVAEEEEVAEADTARAEAAAATIDVPMAAR